MIHESNTQMDFFRINIKFLKTFRNSIAVFEVCKHQVFLVVLTSFHCVHIIANKEMSVVSLVYETNMIILLQRVLINLE